VNKTIGLGALVCALALSLAAQAQDFVWAPDHCPDLVTWKKGEQYGNPCVTPSGWHGIILHDVEIHTARFEVLRGPGDPPVFPAECQDGQVTEIDHIVCAVRD